MSTLLTDKGIVVVDGLATIMHYGLDFVAPAYSAYSHRQQHRLQHPYRQWFTERTVINLINASYQS